MTSEAQACSRTLGEEESIWFKIHPFINADEPITILMRLSDRYGNCIPRIVSELTLAFTKHAPSH